MTNVQIAVSGVRKAQLKRVLRLFALGHIEIDSDGDNLHKFALPESLWRGVNQAELRAALMETGGPVAVLKESGGFGHVIRRR